MKKVLLVSPRGRRDDVLRRLTHPVERVVEAPSPLEGLWRHGPDVDAVVIPHDGGVDVVPLD